MANLISNPSFETTTTPWYLDSDYSRVSTDHYDGSYCIKQASASGYASLISEQLTVVANTAYTLTFYAEVTVTSGNPPKLQLNKTNGTTGQILLQDIPNNSGVWTKQTINFTTAVGQTALWVRILNYGGAITAYYDLFDVEPPVTTSIFKVSSVAKASISKISGVALASVGKVAGLA